MGTIDLLADQMHELELKLLDPKVRASKAAVGSLLAQGFVEFASSGEIYDRQQVMEALEMETPAERTLTDFRVLSLGPAAVLITYRCDGAMANGGAAVTSIRSSVWRLEDGEWRMAFHQGTLIPRL